MPSKNAFSNLLVVAHPDDETLFFAGLIQSRKDWHVVCVTDGNADGLGLERKKQYLRACKSLKVRNAEMFSFPDQFGQKIDLDLLIEKLKNLGSYKNIFTHSIVGEYGHRHHQDVSMAVHKAFEKNSVYSVSYNSYPDLKITLTPQQFKAKTDILWNIYSGEIKRLIHFLPAHSFEGFVKVSLEEVETLYQWLTAKKPLNEKQIRVYKWLIPYLKAGGGHLPDRPF